jgi:hypothetical protein
MKDIELFEVNLANLKWLETYSKQCPELQLDGIEILRCFTYDLIQVFNNAYLSEHTDGASQP